MARLARARAVSHASSDPHPLCRSAPSVRSAGEGAHAHAGEGRLLKFFITVYRMYCGPCSCDYRVWLDVYDMIGIKCVLWRRMSEEIGWREGAGEGEREGDAGYFWIAVIYL